MVFTVESFAKSDIVLIFMNKNLFHRAFKTKKGNVFQSGYIVNILTLKIIPSNIGRTNEYS